MTSRYTHFVGPRLDSRSATAPANGSDLITIERSFASFASNAGPTGVLPLGIIPANVEVISAHVSPNSSQAGSASHYYDYHLIDMGLDGSGTDIVASKTLSAAGEGIAQGVASAGAMSVASAQKNLTGPAQLGVSYAKTGNGIAIVAHAISVTYRLR